MFSRSPAVAIVLGSGLLLAVMIGALYWISRPVPSLEIYCAAAMLKPIQMIAKDYEAEFGRNVVIHSGPSQYILTQMEMAKEGDLFLPADESYIRQAAEKELIGDVKDVASMQAVIIVRPGFSKEIKTWDDFLAVGNKIGLANLGATAIGNITKRELQARGLWDSLAASGPTYLGDVNEVGSSVAETGSSNAGITWDALAKTLAEKKPGLKVVKLKELDGVKARVQIAVAKSTTQREEALRFIAFVRAKDKGAAHLKKAGYSVAEDAEGMNAQKHCTQLARRTDIPVPLDEEYVPVDGHKRPSHTPAENPRINP